MLQFKKLNNSGRAPLPIFCLYIIKKRERERERVEQPTKIRVIIKIIFF